MTFEQAVGRVQKTMENADPKKIGDVAVQIRFTNSDCQGTMYISTKTGELDVQGYDYRDSDAAVELIYGDLSKILTGKLSAANAIERGEVTIVSGNPNAFIALGGCAKKAALKQTPAKKSAAGSKKAAPKKTAVQKSAPAKDTPVKEAVPQKKAEPKKAPKKKTEKK